MGRYYWDKKDTVEDCRSISISFLKKHGYLTGYSCSSGLISWKNCYGEETSSVGIVVSTIEGENFVRFYYTETDHKSGEKTDYDYNVQLTTTPCNFGGVRCWFICPLSRDGVYCGRRVVSGGTIELIFNDFGAETSFDCSGISTKPKYILAKLLNSS